MCVRAFAQPSPSPPGPGRNETLKAGLAVTRNVVLLLALWHILYPCVWGFVLSLLSFCPRRRVVREEDPTPQTSSLFPTPPIQSLASHRPITPPLP